MKNNYNVFNEVPLKTIHPKGWLFEFLRTQATGLTGNLQCAGFPFDSVSWAADDVDTTDLNKNPGWWVYEQTAYWVDGMERCAELIGDKELLEAAGKSFRYVLDRADSDGYMGPKLLKKSDGWNLWPHVVFFRALMARYSSAGNFEIIEKLTNFYLKFNADFSNSRDVLHIEIMLLLYKVNKNISLLRLAEETYSKYNEKCTDDNCVASMSSRKKPYAHGVSYNEFCKLGAMLYSCTGNTDYLKPVINAYNKMQRWQMLVDGCPCSNEFMLDNDYMQSHETCDVSDYSWSLGYLLMATGDGKYADMIERCIFNAGIGSVTENFRALQYFSCPNQLILDSKSNHNSFFKGESWMSYRPNPGTECCPGNVNRFFPNYCSRMWMQDDKNIWAVLYGASSFEFSINGNRVEVEEKTDYPFEDKINFEFKMKNALTFGFCLRIPAWCESPGIYVNGKPLEFAINKGFVKIERTFQPNDNIEAVFPSEVKIVELKKDACYVEKGPLLYSLGMKGNRIVDTADNKSTADFPAYNIYPDKEWNYALSTDEKDISKIKVCRHYTGGNPWTIENAPITIKIIASRVDGWELGRKKRVSKITKLYLPVERHYEMGDFVFTPRLPDKKLLSPENLGKKETIELVPYALAKLRLTVFPKC